MCVCVCACACVRACVCACMCVYVVPIGSLQYSVIFAEGTQIEINIYMCVSPESQWSEAWMMTSAPT